MNMDVTLMRFLWILVTIGVFPFALLAYIAAWILMPSEAMPAYSTAPSPGMQA